MRLLRPVVLAILIAGAFFYFTTYRNGLHAPGWVSRPAKLELTEAAGNDSLDSEEQNNIKVYRSNIPAVVNITSKAVAFDFFYGLVPQEGQGSGFVIDKEGHILTNYHVIDDAQPQEVSRHHCGQRSRARPCCHPDQGPRPGSRSPRRLARSAGRAEGVC